MTIKHADNLDVSGCNLRQDTEGHATWKTPLGTDWKTPKDYSSADRGGRKAYWGWYFKDAPGVVQGFDKRPTGQMSVWWQAHVYIEEAPKIEKWWGYSGSAKWDVKDKPSYKMDLWTNEKKNQYYPKIN